MVDIIGSDGYGMVWGDSDPTTRQMLSRITDEPCMLRWLASFADRHDKPTCIGEWANTAPPRQQAQHRAWPGRLPGVYRRHLRLGEHLSPGLPLRVLLQPARRRCGAHAGPDPPGSLARLKAREGGKVASRKAPGAYKTFRDKENGCIKVVLKP